ncbi:calpain-like cysteine peptidase, putative [Leishmania tarentolae]|uniref:Calpain-like cysteine peptidase, putative n=1 Tax=Leishmania tarentolae TaxID=5689 RepID=A0A640KKY3_LEITA|nr:calpain-like cysteine peptidase, putative [Leishmania tarentolae]
MHSLWQVRFALSCVHALGNGRRTLVHLVQELPQRGGVCVTGVEHFHVRSLRVTVLSVLAQRQRPRRTAPVIRRQALGTLLRNTPVSKRLHTLLHLLLQRLDQSGVLLRVLPQLPQPPLHVSNLRVAIQKRAQLLCCQRRIHALQHRSLAGLHRNGKITRTLPQLLPQTRSLLCICAGAGAHAAQPLHLHLVESGIRVQWQLRRQHALVQLGKDLATLTVLQLLRNLHSARVQLRLLERYAVRVARTALFQLRALRLLRAELSILVDRQQLQRNSRRLRSKIRAVARKSTPRQLTRAGKQLRLQSCNLGPVPRRAHSARALLLQAAKLGVLVQRQRPQRHTMHSLWQVHFALSCVHALGNGRRTLVHRVQEPLQRSNFRVTGFEHFHVRSLRVTVLSVLAQRQRLRRTAPVLRRQALGTLLRNTPVSKRLHTLLHLLLQRLDRIGVLLRVLPQLPQPPLHVSNLRVAIQKRAQLLCCQRRIHALQHRSLAGLHRNSKITRTLPQLLPQTRSLLRICAGAGAHAAQPLHLHLVESGIRVQWQLRRQHALVQLGKDLATLTVLQLLRNLHGARVQLRLLERYALRVARTALFQLRALRLLRAELSILVDRQQLQRNSRRLRSKIRAVARKSTPRQLTRAGKQLRLQSCNLGPVPRRAHSARALLLQAAKLGVLVQRQRPQRHTMHSLWQVRFALSCVHALGNGRRTLVHLVQELPQRNGVCVTGVEHFHVRSLRVTVLGVLAQRQRPRRTAPVIRRQALGTLLRNTPVSKRLHTLLHLLLQRLDQSGVLLRVLPQLPQPPLHVSNLRVAIQKRAQLLCCQRRIHALQHRSLAGLHRNGKITRTLPQLLPQTRSLLCICAGAGAHAAQPLHLHLVESGIRVQWQLRRQHALVQLGKDLATLTVLQLLRNLHSARVQLRLLERYAVRVARTALFQLRALRLLRAELSILVDRQQLQRNSRRLRSKIRAVARKSTPRQLTRAGKQLRLQSCNLGPVPRRAHSARALLLQAAKLGVLVQRQRPQRHTMHSLWQVRFALSCVHALGNGRRTLVHLVQELPQRNGVCVTGVEHFHVRSLRVTVLGVLAQRQRPRRTAPVIRRQALGTLLRNTPVSKRLHTLLHLLLQRLDRIGVLLRVLPQLPQPPLHVSNLRVAIQKRAQLLCCQRRIHALQHRSLAGLHRNGKITRTLPQLLPQTRSLLCICAGAGAHAAQPLHLHLVESGIRVQWQLRRQHALVQLGKELATLTVLQLLRNLHSARVQLRLLERYALRVARTALFQLRALRLLRAELSILVDRQQLQRNSRRLRSKIRAVGRKSTPRQLTRAGKQLRLQSCNLGPVPRRAHSARALLLQAAKLGVLVQRQRPQRHTMHSLWQVRFALSCVHALGNGRRTLVHLVQELPQRNGVCVTGVEHFHVRSLRVTVLGVLAQRQRPRRTAPVIRRQALGTLLRNTPVSKRLHTLLHLLLQRLDRIGVLLRVLPQLPQPPLHVSNLRVAIQKRAQLLCCQRRIHALQHRSLAGLHRNSKITRTLPQLLPQTRSLLRICAGAGAHAAQPLHLHLVESGIRVQWQLRRQHALVQLGKELATLTVLQLLRNLHSARVQLRLLERYALRVARTALFQLRALRLLRAELSILVDRQQLQRNSRRLRSKIRAVARKSTPRQLTRAGKQLRLQSCNLGPVPRRAHSARALLLQAAKLGVLVQRQRPQRHTMHSLWQVRFALSCVHALGNGRRTLVHLVQELPQRNGVCVTGVEHFHVRSLRVTVLGVLAQRQRPRRTAPVIRRQALGTLLRNTPVSKRLHTLLHLLLQRLDRIGVLLRVLPQLPQPPLHVSNLRVAIQKRAQLLCCQRRIHALQHRSLAGLHRNSKITRTLPQLLPQTRSLLRICAGAGAHAAQPLHLHLVESGIRVQWQLRHRNALVRLGKELATLTVLQLLRNLHSARVQLRLLERYAVRVARTALFQLRALRLLRAELSILVDRQQLQRNSRRLRSKIRAVARKSTPRQLTRAGKQLRLQSYNLGPVPRRAHSARALLLQAAKLGVLVQRQRPQRHTMHSLWQVRFALSYVHALGNGRRTLVHLVQELPQRNGVCVTGVEHFHVRSLRVTVLSVLAQRQRPRRTAPVIRRQALGTLLRNTPVSKRLHTLLHLLLQRLDRIGVLLRVLPQLPQPPLHVSNLRVAIQKRAQLLCCQRRIHALQHRSLAGLHRNGKITRTLPQLLPQTRSLLRICAGAGVHAAQPLHLHLVESGIRVQ